MEIPKIRLVKLSIFIVMVVVINIIAVCSMKSNISNEMKVKVSVSNSLSDTYQIFYGLDREWSEDKSIKLEYVESDEVQELVGIIPKDIKHLRIDMGTKQQSINIQNIQLEYYGDKQELVIVDLPIESLNNIDRIEEIENELQIITNGTDPYIMIDIDSYIINRFTEQGNKINLMIIVLILTIMDSVIFLFVKKRRIIIEFIKDIVIEKQLVYRLAKNDFKTKYAGSYLGITWAFVQPIISILVYWFVFQVGLKSAPVGDFPFVLWLVAGLVPWFFFSEAWMNATSSLMEYSYLVKKVVFKINILPVVKILSALFVHIFFLGFSLVLFVAYGYYPDIYIVQLLYYMMCMILLVMGISYATSAIVLFFKDLGQIITIILQVGMWMTPIMWSYNMVPTQYQWILKMNPMYYIVQGYRDSLINKVWVWEYPIYTIYFWGFVIGSFIVGITMFKKLRPHFADVI